MKRPVIVGVGEIRDRPAQVAEGLDPLGLMTAALWRAEADSGVALLDRVDALEVVHQISWRYEDTARRLCERIGIAPPRAVYHPGGGESPVRILHEAALRIARGESRVVAICAGEARSTARKARQERIDLPWSPRATAMEHRWNVSELLAPMALAHGIDQPVFIYPFYENAVAQARGQTPREAQAESAELWHRLSEVAAANPYAWHRGAVPAAEIVRFSDQNPPVAWPYSRLMVANPTVNLGAALLVMAEDEAIAAGIQSDRMLHILAGAAANEAEDFLIRDSYQACPAQEAVLGAISAHAPRNGFDAVELYSCFPCVPKMALHSLPVGTDVPTVTGGLTFFGGPFSGYMLHATCAMVRRLRPSGGTGLLYGQGNFVTKHHALVLASEPGSGLSEQYCVNAEADRLRGPIPPIVDRAEGTARIETFTALFDRAGAPDRGVVILRTPEGARTMARVPRNAHDTIARLIDWDRSPIGASGICTIADDGLLEWRLAS